MAPPTPNTSLADQLVASFLPDESPASKLRRDKDTFSRRLKVHNYARTNQFEVAERLDALQEKLQILNNEELADAIHDRLVKLQHHSETWLPDVLHLLLCLSDDPTSKTKIEWLDNSNTRPWVAPLITWTEIEADDPLDRKDHIWKVAEYSDLSSDDDDVAAAPPKSLIPETADPVHEKQEVSTHVNLEFIDRDAGLNALDRLRQEQFWQNLSKEPFELTELQVIREILFMLQGLPANLFWKIGDRFEMDKRFRLNKTSLESFVDVISGFGRVAMRLDLLRRFVKEAQSVRFMQVLRSNLEGILQNIDTQLRTFEQDILTVESEAPATILRLFAAVSEVVEVAASLVNFVADIQSRAVDAVRCLELLFERVCQAQAVGDEAGFKCLSNLFFNCFESFFHLVRDWMDKGVLCENQETMFVAPARLDQDSSELWQKWYKPTDDSVPNRCPIFLHSVKDKIFNTGKTVVFLHRLNVCYGDFENTPPLKMQESSPIHANSLVPFSEAFVTSVENFVESRLQIATSTLRDHLGSNCGLWKILDALSNVYLGKNGWVVDFIDSKLFTAIDRRDKSWHDRFLLGNLLKTVFELSDCVDVERLSVKPSANPLRNLPYRWQSVKLLRELRIQYALPWSVANVITRASLATYQKVSTLLTQIRRARYMLERRCFFQVRGGQPGADLRARNLNQLIHHDLLLVVNILYDHLTGLVIEEGNSRLRQDLTNAVDIDAMIAAHNKYCDGLEDACLISKRLKPIHDEIVSILDLCIRLSDLNNLTKRRSSDADVHSYVSANSHQRDRHRDDGEEDSSDEEGQSEDGEGYSTFIVPEESSLEDQLRKVRGELDKHLSFVVAGLKSIEVAEQGSSWEILGSRLHWKRNSSYG